SSSAYPVLCPPRALHSCPTRRSSDLDGAMQMNGNGELVTVQQYWKQWKDPRFVVMVLVNHDLNQVTWEQRVLAGDPKYREAQNVDRKSTRLNSSHAKISYAVFCVKHR